MLVLVGHCLDLVNIIMIMVRAFQQDYIQTPVLLRDCHKSLTNHLHPVQQPAEGTPRD